MIRWFKTRRALVAMLDERGNTIAKQIDEIAGLRADAKTTAEATESRIGFMQRAVNGLRRSTQAEYRLRTEAENKLARVVEELKTLRDDIARQERIEAEALTYMPVRGFGLARPADRPMVWQTADAIDQDAAAKRQQDGLGDPK